MKKITLTLVSLFAAGTFVYADEEVQTDENALVKDAVNSIAESNKGELGTEEMPDSTVWKFNGGIALNASQSYHNAYSMDGKGVNVALDGNIKLALEMIKQRHKWNSGLNLSLGGNYSTEYTHAPRIHKTLDEIYFFTKYGYKVSKTVYYSARASLETQFAPTYDYDAIDAWYENEYNLEDAEGNYIYSDWKDLDDAYDKLSDHDKDSISIKSWCGNPLIVKGSIGIDIQPVPKEKFTIFISPVTGRFTICKDDMIAPNYSMEAETDEDGNITGYKNVRSEIGALLRIDYSKEFNKVFTLTTGLEGFYSYNKSIQERPDDVKKRYWLLPNGKYIDRNTSYVYKEKDKNDKEVVKRYYECMDNPPSDEWESKNGWSVRFNLDMEFNLTKVLKLAIRTQLKYDNSEVTYHKDIQELRKNTRNIPDPENGRIDLEGTDLHNRLINKGNNYGYKKAFLQIWEATSLGVAYTF